MDTIQEKAREIGRQLSQTDEYKAVKRANERLQGDRETITLVNRLGDLEGQITSYLQAGKTPAQELQDEYTQVAEELQQKAAYQAVVAAQSNFERLMSRINDDIARGIQAGEQSRIILP